MGSWAQVAAIIGAVLGRLPFTLIEKMRTAHKLSRMPAMNAPLFIVGHWRSGTTHLYNVLSKSGRFGFVPPIATGLPWDFLGLGHWLRPLLTRALPEHRFIDNVAVAPDSPQEDEIALASMTDISFYHGLYFPRRLLENFDRGVFFEGCSQADIAAWTRVFVYFMEKLSIEFEGRQLLIKNPVYTARVALLHRIWPDAKFIHIHRNPYMVMESTKNFYAKLLSELALQPYDHLAIEEFIFTQYARMMDCLIEESAALPEGHFVEVSFDEFEADPLVVMRRIHETLRLDGFAEAEPRFESYLASVAGYRKNNYRLSPENENAIRLRTRWRRYLDRWNYDFPGPQTA
jgi:hypothetical protein